MKNVILYIILALMKKVIYIWLKIHVDKLSKNSHVYIYFGL